MAVTLFIGLAVAVAITAGSSAGERSFSVLAPPVQSLMSVSTPFLGVLLVSDLRRDRALRLVPTLLGAAAVAVGVALYGVLVCGLATAASGGGWQHAGASAVGTVLVQLLAQFIGTGLGLLIRSPVLASLASIVLPLGLWLALGAVPLLRPWLTPFAWVETLTAGQMDPPDWWRWLVVAALWGVGLNALGGWRRRQRQ